ncbi:hypothetical protein [Rhizobium sp. TRM95796]|uniref:hypothetical protein n=1 Tax=Rhizobium sp. TRM95796 TaxID=2979862 RepID=UPI0021E8C455|nr:hypothetical protein [Rhizobium sp. TRM95796]MCV3764217.1 hypothetical protein [Rhizobium sp. TRM95796]
MSHNSPPENSPNENPIVIKFTRSEFKEFVLETSQTPSEERRVFSLGFDITREDIKQLYDKLFYVISTNNNLFSSEFSATIYMKKNKIRKVNSVNDFFNIENYPSELLKGISITLSYFIFFLRDDGLNIPEKQIVNIRFSGGSIGSIEVSVRSTEFSWPESIFSQVELEIEALRENIFRKNPVSRNVFLRGHELFSEYINIAPNLIFLFFLFSASLVFGVFGSTVGASSNNNNIQIYSQEEKRFKDVGLDYITNSSDIGVAVNRVRDAEFIKKVIPDQGGVGKLFRDLKRFIVDIPLYLIFVFSVFCVFVYLNIREMKKLALNKVGRIWLSSKPIPDRESLPPAGGVVESFGISLFASVVFALLVALLGSLAN